MILFALIGAVIADTCQSYPNGTPCTCVRTTDVFDPLCKDFVLGGMEVPAPLKRSAHGHPWATGFPNPTIGGLPSTVLNGFCVGARKPVSSDALVQSDAPILDTYYTCEDFELTPALDQQPNTFIPLLPGEESACCALQVGFNGDEGSQGPVGLQGDDGPQGPKGPNGKKVLTQVCSMQIVRDEMILEIGQNVCSLREGVAVGETSGGNERVSISVSVVYARVASSSSSSSESSSLSTASRCGPTITVKIDGVVVFKSSKALFASKGVVSGEFELTLSAGQHSVEIDVAPQHCSASDLTLANPAIVAMVL